jgi:hypothetical protein
MQSTECENTGVSLIAQSTFTGKKNLLIKKSDGPAKYVDQSSSCFFLVGNQETKTGKKEERKKGMNEERKKRNWTIIWDKC